MGEYFQRTCSSNFVIGFLVYSYNLRKKRNNGKSLINDSNYVIVTKLIEVMSSNSWWSPPLKFSQFSYQCTYIYRSRRSLKIPVLLPLNAFRICQKAEKDFGIHYWSIHCDCEPFCVFYIRNILHWKTSKRMAGSSILKTTFY